jgi:purine-cytosine permease-like protein
MFIPTVWLAILGASIASVPKSADPAVLVTQVFGGIVAILVMLMVLHGPIATNILNVYSSALAAVSAGIKATRIQLGVVAGIVGYVVTLYFVAHADFASQFDNWMVGLILWMAPWAGVVLADFYLVRKQDINVAELYAPPETSMYGDVNWIGIWAFIIGLAAGWLFEYGLVTPLQGLISKHLLQGADLSWLVGMVVAGGIYVVGMRNRATNPVTAPSAVAAAG